MVRKRTKVKIVFLYSIFAMLTSLILFSAVSCNQTAAKQLVLQETTTVDSTGQSVSVENTADETISFVGSINVEPLRATIGSSIIVSGTGLPSNENLDLVWNTFEGSYDIQGDYLEEYHGRIFKNAKYIISEIQTDAEGNFQQNITVPEDYGFNHNITIERGEEVLNRVGFSIEPTASIDKTSGPLGTLITITMNGIGTQSMENSWTLMYDNKFTGLITSVTTKGTATAVIPATGGLGKHVIGIIHGAFQFPYLNTQQNPQPYHPVFYMEFTVTEGEPVLPTPVEDQGFPVKNGTAPDDPSKEPAIWIDPAEGPIETGATLNGSGFSPGKEILFQWATVTGNRVSGSGWEEGFTELGNTIAGEDGSFAFNFTIPDDLGGNHRIDAIVDGTSIADTNFTVKPSAIPLEIFSGPVGTQLTINLKGIGWTETSNIYTLVYDNSYLGYGCGFNSQGDITIYLPLTGGPGWHFIDLYPAIYKGEEIKGTQNFRVPLLTYEDDHPGEKLPAFHYAVEVTE